MESLLNHGLSFVAIPIKLNITQLKTDIDKYTRTMLWKYFWFETEDNVKQSSSQNTTQINTPNTIQNCDQVYSVLKSNKLVDKVVDVFLLVCPYF